MPSLQFASKETNSGRSFAGLVSYRPRRWAQTVELQGPSPHTVSQFRKLERENWFPSPEDAQEESGGLNKSRGLTEYSC